MTKEPIMDEKKPTTAESLRMLADWYEAHPDMPAPRASVLALSGNGLESPDGARRVARALGFFEKGGTDSFLILKKPFGAVALEFSFWRESICKKRVVQEEIVEWDCPALLDGEKEAA